MTGAFFAWAVGALFGLTFEWPEHSCPSREEVERAYAALVKSSDAHSLVDARVSAHQSHGEWVLSIRHHGQSIERHVNASAPCDEQAAMIAVIADQVTRPFPDALADVSSETIAARPPSPQTPVSPTPELLPFAAGLLTYDAERGIRPGLAVGTRIHWPSLALAGELSWHPSTRWSAAGVEISAQDQGVALSAGVRALAFFVEAGVMLQALHVTGRGLVENASIWRLNPALFSSLGIGKTREGFHAALFVRGRALLRRQEIAVSDVIVARSPRLEGEIVAAIGRSF